MHNRNLVLGLVLGGCAVVAACSSDSDDNANTGGTGGTHSTAGAGGSAGKASGGSAGKAAGGTSAGGNAGASDNGGAKDNGGADNGGAVNGEAGQGGEGGAPVVVVPPPPLNAQFVLLPVAAPTAAPTSVLAAGTDYSQTQFVSVTLATGAVSATLDVSDDGDAVPVSSGGLGFVLERTKDRALLLDGATAKTTFDLTDPGTATTALTSNKAYVGLYNKSLVSVLDLAANKVSRRIDLSAFNAASDADGSADITAAAYDPTSKIAYLLLGRIDLTTIVGPDYTLPCSATKSVIVGIDTTTDAVVDLNGAAAGQALELTLASPQTLSIDSTGKLLTVAASGCYTAGALGHNGVEILNLTSGTSTVTYAGPTAGSTTNLVLLGGNAALLAVDESDFTTHWFKLDLGAGTLGTELLNVPSTPSYDGTNLIGVKASNGTAEVVRYDIATDQVTATISTGTLTGLFKTPYGTALVQ